MRTNKRTITYRGVTDTIEGWAKRLGLWPTAIHNRISRYGLAPESLYIVLSPRMRGPRYGAFRNRDTAAKPLRQRRDLALMGILI